MKSPHRLIGSIARHLGRDEGIALITGVGFSAALTVATTVVVFVSVTNYNSATHQRADQTAYALAEAGLNNAFATLANAADPSSPGAVPVRTASLPGGTVTYSGTLQGSEWTLTGTGHVVNTVTHNTEVTRTVTARAHWKAAKKSSPNNAVYNYLYADDPNSCFSMDNSAWVDVPIYTRGDLCLSNSASVTGLAVQALGKITLSNTAHIGSAEAPVNEVHVKGGCALNGGATHDPCLSADQVYGQVVDNAPGTLGKPPLDLASAYDSAAPGPLHPCTSGNVPAGGFDNNTKLDHSRKSVDLFTKNAYDCKVVDAKGAIVGQLAWSPTTNVLTIAGTIFFDGDVVVDNLTRATYVGRATIISSGTVTLKNNTQLCGVDDCGAGWDPAQNLLAFVAGSSTAATSVTLDNHTTFQGSIYAVNDYSQSNNTTVWGPVVARRISLKNSTENHMVPIAQ
jgi:Tfp pilus assembly protein PilX